MAETTNDKLVRVVVLFPPELAERIQNIVRASKLPTTRSHVIRELVLERLEAGAAHPPSVRATVGS